VRGRSSIQVRRDRFQNAANPIVFSGRPNSRCPVASMRTATNPLYGSAIAISRPVFRGRKDFDLFGSLPLPRRMKGATRGRSLTAETGCGSVVGRPYFNSGSGKVPHRNVFVG